MEEEYKALSMVMKDLIPFCNAWMQCLQALATTLQSELSSRLQSGKIVMAQ